MKPNGVKSVIRGVLFIGCAVLGFSSIGSAQTARGTFKLPVAARWGTVLLSPGEYEFTVGSESDPRLVVLHSLNSQSSGMIMSEALTDVTPGAGWSLQLTHSEGGTYVRALYLNDLGVALQFEPAKNSKVAISRPRSTTMASASGTH